MDQIYLFKNLLKFNLPFNKGAICYKWSAPNTAYSQWRAFQGAKFGFSMIARVPRKVIALNSATAHTRKR
jgi:hypothetical protein